VLAARYRRRELLPAPDEMSAPSPDLRRNQAFLSRAAAAHSRVRAGLPLRGVGRAFRPDARARLLPERRAYLLPLRPGEGRVHPRDAPARALLRPDEHQR